MKRTICGFVALMCVTNIAFASSSFDDYLRAAGKKITKIMSSKKDINEKVSILLEKMAKLANKTTLNDKQQAELRELYFNLGKIYYEKFRNYLKAANFFSKAEAIKDNGTLQFYKGNSLFQCKEYEKAVECFKRALSSGDLNKENFSDLHWLKGCGEYFLGHFDQAEADLTKSCSLDEKKWESASKFLVECFHRRGELVQAEVIVDKMMEQKNYLDFALRKKAELLWETGNYDDCAKAITELEEKFPLDEALHILRAKLGYAVENYDFAKSELDAEYNKKVRNHSYDNEYYMMRSRLAVKESKFDEAFAFLDKVLIEPIPAYVTKLKGDVYLAMGNKAQALDWYQRFMQITPNLNDKNQVEELSNKLQEQLLEESNLPENQ